MLLNCGPAHDRRILDLNLPPTPSLLGVFVSGGIDSALLYYLLMEENRRLGNPHVIEPLTILRKEGSKYFANLVVSHVQSAFELPYSGLTVVGNNTLSEDQQVRSGVRQAYRMGYGQVYVGVIDQIAEHTIGWEKIGYDENDFYRIPFKNLQKFHIVDLVKQFKQEGLFYITHACDQLELSRCHACNGCRERIWGFKQLALQDPGVL